MPVKDQVIESLKGIPVPGVGRSIVQMNLVRDILITDSKLDISLSSTALGQESQEWLRSKIEKTVSKIKGIDKPNIQFSPAAAKDINQIKQIIAVMSGKGGVGKSLVSSLIAASLRRQGYEVGILDADITGPSIPKMFGVSGYPRMSESGMLPLLSKSGIEIMSLNLLLPKEDDAVIWRGPIIGKVITQFWEEVLWGQLDYLIVDLPPGTADAPLTILQQLPVSGIIIVSTPQDLTAMIVKKAVNMAKRMNKPVIGVVENMSYLYVAEMKKKIELFGPSRGEEIAAMAGAPLMARLPVDTELAQLIDRGDIEAYTNDIVEKLGQAVAQAKLNSPVESTSPVEK
jgi:Mrp family chromosome partitioning ATPase